MTEYAIIADVDVRHSSSEGRHALARTAALDAPLTLETAVWAPEIAGMLGFPAVTVGMLRAAIGRGDLRPERHGRAILVSRRQLMEWRETCRAPQKAPGSGSSPRNGTRPPASLGRSRSGGSETATSSSSLAALQRTAQALKKR
ncbi:hypothetical protein ASG63_08610 [Methylobacterium sp. Leaf94]|nr:hypothetical protein ASG63_08610 [Methylobacterium sp. Leaf94]